MDRIEMWENQYHGPEINASKGLKKIPYNENLIQMVMVFVQDTQVKYISTMNAINWNTHTCTHTNKPRSFLFQKKTKYKFNHQMN